MKPRYTNSGPEAPASELALQIETRRSFRRPSPNCHTEDDDEALLHSGMHVSLIAGWDLGFHPSAVSPVG